MDKNKVIIAVLIIVIVALVSAFCITVMQDTKNDSQLTITSNSTVYENDSISVKLMDLNETALYNQTVNINITDENNTSYYYSVRTDDNGTANLSLDKSAGNYTVNCSYTGNENFNGNSTIQTLTIKEKVVEQVSYGTDYNSYSTYSNSYSSSYSTQEDERPEVDSGGITREEADYWGWEYTSDHGGHYHGSHDSWDEEAGMYHD